ncbi:MAG TPA: nucleoside deaminase [Candidatus Limnocylindrales bacterium]|nr:nucleoside deaminase [Candidatus Limnocylindrales bacterium]
MATGTPAPSGAEGLVLRAVAVGRAGMLAHRGGPFGAIVVGPDGRIIGEGCNQVTSTNDPTAHAEVSAIRAACAALGTFQLDGHRLYTSCEPCPMCLAAAYWARVDEIVYGASREDAALGGFDDAFIYDEIGLAPGSRRIPMRRLAQEPAAALFREWLELEGRTAY